MNYAPLRTKALADAPWEGDCKKKPWEYNVTAVIPCLDTPELVEIVVGLLRLQTEKPFIMIIDTGSTPENLAKLNHMRAPDLEVHSLLLNGVRHPSDFPCFACDLAHAMCRTKYLFHTHADVFLTKRTVLAEMMGQLSEECPVIGYEITERPHKDWKLMVGHSLLMYQVDVIDSYGISWSMRRLCGYYDVEWTMDESRPNWPDTEVGFNVLLREAGIVAKIMGTEENFVRNRTEHFDHCRTATSSMLYSPDYYKSCREWLAEATKEAKERIKHWKHEANFAKVMNQ